MLTYAALRSLAKERGYELVLVDMRVGCSEAISWALPPHGKHLKDQVRSLRNTEAP